jgi:hypothetical protein
MGFVSYNFEVSNTILYAINDIYGKPFKTNSQIVTGTCPR